MINSLIKINKISKLLQKISLKSTKLKKNDEIFFSKNLKLTLEKHLEPKNYQKFISSSNRLIDIQPIPKRAPLFPTKSLKFV